MEQTPPAVERPPEWLWNLLVVAIYVPVALGSAVWIGLTRGTAGLWAELVGESVLRDSGLGLAAALLVVGGTRLAGGRWRWARRMEDAMARALGPLSSGTCLLLAVASAVGEELLFRGVIQPWLGLVPASALFAVVHVPVDRDLALWPTFALAAGLLLGGLYLGTGALLAPILCHFGINYLNLRHLARVAAQEDLERLDDGFFQ